MCHEAVKPYAVTSTRPCWWLCNCTASPIAQYRVSFQQLIRCSDWVALAGAGDRSRLRNFGLCAPDVSSSFGAGDLFVGGRKAGAWNWPHPQLVLRSRMSGVVPPVPHMSSGHGQRRLDLSTYAASCNAYPACIFQTPGNLRFAV